MTGQSTGTGQDSDRQKQLEQPGFNSLQIWAPTESLTVSIHNPLRIHYPCGQDVRNIMLVTNYVSRSVEEDTRYLRKTSRVTQTIVTLVTSHGLALCLPPDTPAT